MAIRQDIIDSDRKLVEGIINQLIRLIYEIDFSNEDVSVFQMYAPEEEDLTHALRDKILSETRVKVTKEYCIKAYVLEDEDFDIRKDAIPATSLQFKEFKESEQSVSRQDQIDNLLEFISTKKLNEQAQQMISPLISLLEDCDDFDEAYELLTDKNLHSKKFEQSLHQKALFYVSCKGVVMYLIKLINTRIFE